MGDRFYDFYTLLNIPPPTSASWLFSTTSSLPFDADAVKKCYRKASLKHHPDKGGNPATFIRLKRAQKVLSDDGLRARYDLLGLDSGRDDGSTDPPPDAAEGEAEESDRSGGSSLKQLHAAVSGHLLSALVKCVGLYFILLVIQYKYLLLPASLGLWFVVGFRGGDVDKEARIIIACVPVAACVMLWSGAGGWVFWLGEGTAIGLAILFNFPPEFQNLKLGGGLLLFGNIVAWWFCARFWNYLCVCLLLVFLFVVCLIIFPLCEHLIKEDTDALLKIYSEKIREAMLNKMEDDRKAAKN